MRDTDGYDNKDAVAEPLPLVYTAVVRKSNGDPIAAYTRRSVQQGATFNKPLKGDENYVGVNGMVKNADGSYKFSQGPNGETVTYPSFKLEDHEATRRDFSGSNVAYKAVKLH